jgi:hypothetical protein
MSLIPMTSDGGLSSRQSAQANKSQRWAEMAVFSHSLEVAVATEFERIDSHALAEVIRIATECELQMLDYGLVMAGNSAAKRELVARKVNLLSNINNARISNRFGR